jgi:drug/metabolite transporter (DMT)-like permease
MPAMIRKRRTAGIAAGVAIALFWGVSFLSIKIAVAVIPPMTLGLVRFVGATLLLAALKLFLAPRDRLAWKDLPPLAAAGLIGVTLYFFMENNGVKLLTASEASVAIAFIPIMSLIAERVFLKNRLSPLQYSGAVLSTLGVFLLVSSGLSLRSGVRGYLFMLGAGLSWVAYAFITRKLFERHQRITVVFWQSLFGTLGFLPFALLESKSWIPVSASVWLNVAFLAVACSALGYWLYAACVDILGLTASSVFINLIPVVSLAAGFLILGERLGPAQYSGSAVVLVGVFLATLSSPRKASKSDPGEVHEEAY